MSKAPVQSQANSGRRHDRDALLDAAVQVFARDGFRAGSVARIAEAAGSTRPTLYSRFGSKEGLYAAAVEREAERVVAHLAAAYERLGDEPPLALVRGAIDAWLQYVVAAPDSFRLLTLAEREEVAARHVARAAASIGALIEQLVRRGPDGDGDLPDEVTAPVTAMIVGTARSAGEQLAATGGRDLALVSHLATGFVVGGLGELLSPGR